MPPLRKKMRVAVGISDWPEELGKRFDIVDAQKDETDEQLIARARSCYYPELKIEIERR